MTVEVGTLEAMVAFERNGTHVTDLSKATKTTTTYTVRWVEVPDRDARELTIREHLADSQVTRARKLEGQWWGDGGAYFVASYGRTDDGSIHEHDGQVWFFDPTMQTVTLTTIFAVNEDGAGVDGPDNITVSPHGGIILADHRLKRIEGFDGMLPMLEAMSQDFSWGRSAARYAALYRSLT